MSGKGKRYDYDAEPKLNYKKIFAVIIAIIVLVMFVVIIKRILASGGDTGTIISSTYFVVYDEEKYGVINQKGDTVIAPSYEELIIIPDNKKDVFLITYNINDETEEYSSKALNSKNEEIFTEYTKIEALENFDSNNNVWYEEDVLKVEKDGLYGLIDLDGNELLACEYNSISVILGVENSILVEKDGLYGLVNTEGRKILDTQYASIQSFGDDYTQGYIVANTENKYGVVDYLGSKKLDTVYESVEKIYGSNSYVITEGGVQKLVSSDGEILLESGYNSIKQILSNSTSGIVFELNGVYGIMSTSGEVIIANQYEDLTEVKNSVYIAKRNNMYGIINNQNEVLLDFIYTSISYNSVSDLFIAEKEDYTSDIIDSQYNVQLTGILSEFNESSGYMKLRIDGEYKYYNFKFEEKSVDRVLISNKLYLSKKDDKYGFVNSNGDVVVDYIYDDATELNSYGYAGVKLNGLWGAIDENGTVVVEPKYQLDNNYIIDFIGKWHLGRDINMNYYCQD